MKYPIKTLILLILFTVLVRAQTAVIIPEVTVPSRGQIEIPVIVNGFYGIGALSLEIKYDTSVVSYLGISGNNPEFLDNASNGFVYVAYASLTSLNTGNDTIFYLRFQHNGGSTNLTLTQNCETADYEGTVLASEYFSGKIIDPLAQRSTLGDRVWIDQNKNGIQDNGEPGLPWVTVDLFDCNNRWIEYTLTDSLGHYQFPGLDQGDYILQFTLIDANSSYKFTASKVGDNDQIDSDVEELLSDSLGRIICVSLTAGVNLFNYDAGVISATSNELTDYALLQNFPNPFNPITTISFTIPQRELVTITIYNILGEKVRVILNEVMEAGMNSIEFNAEGLRSSVYFYRMSTSSTVLTGKMVLAR